MSTIHVLPERFTIQGAPGETLLESLLRAGVAHAHACGGRARCSTCRVEVQAGIEHCNERNGPEQQMADRLRFAPDLRLACQTVPSGDVTVRRLVLDDDDVELLDQTRRARGNPSGSVAGVERCLTILFADIRGFTSFSEPLPPHDVVHVLNRYFHAMGKAIARHGGHIDNYMGDGLLALFGLDGHADAAPLAGVRAGLDMLEAMDALQPYLHTAYGAGLDIGVGIHCGEAVVGSVGAAGLERVTAVGDAVNYASRIESANKQAHTRLLISDELLARVRPHVRIAGAHRVPIAGKPGEHVLHAVAGMRDATDASDGT